MIKMGATAGLLLLTLLCVSVGGVRGECRHVDNDDMIEYYCIGGDPSDLNYLPESTGMIRIENMPIPRITRTTFSRFGPDLWVLGCSHCGIVDIEPDAFRHLENLQQLRLDNNYLTAIEESWFRGLNYLTYLDLNYNNIRIIENGVFKNLPSLVELRLSGNRLECLDLEAMLQLKDLKRMLLSENSEFKCPNAVSAFLEFRGVSFERDPEWDKIPTDLITVELPYEYEIEYEDEITSVPTTPIPITPTTPVPTTPVPTTPIPTTPVLTAQVLTTPLPTYRERLHLASSTSHSPMESTSYYTPPRFYTTEEVVYRPMYVTPDSATSTVIPPVYTTTDSSYVTRQFDNLDETSLRTWLRFPESISARPESPLYTHHENEDSRYEQPYHSSEATSPSSLASGPGDRHEMPTFVESVVDQTTGTHEITWTENTVAWELPPVVNNRPPEYRVPPTVPPTVPTHVVQTLPPTSPALIQPGLPGGYGVPYYEHPVTVHSPPSYPPDQGVAITVATPILTTTEKPLPNCSHNQSSLMERSFAVLIVSLLLVFMGDVFVEGF